MTFIFVKCFHKFSAYMSPTPQELFSRAVFKNVIDFITIGLQSTPITSY